MPQIEQVLIRCEVLGNGMFPTEKRVSITGLDGSTVTLLADRALLETRDHEQFLRATRLSVENGVSVCLLPTEETDSGSRWIKVRNSDLLEAA
jgi:hypothetical protein